MSRRAASVIQTSSLSRAKLREARPAWERAQERLRARLPKGTWATLLDFLPELTRLADTA